MAEISFEENFEEKVVYCTTPKRKNRIKIHIPLGNFPYWKIVYEDGNPIEGLSEGVFTSRLDAIKCVKEWERTAKATESAKQYELFGDKKPPELKRKKVRGSVG